jgi:ketosteroid isomerase-like protein
MLMMLSALLALTVVSGQPTVDAVRAAEGQRIQALLAADFATVDRLLADELTYTHSNAKRDNKAAYMEPFLSGRTRYQRLEPSEISVRVYGDTAIMTGRMLSVALVAGAESRTDLRFTSVWILRDGRWQMAAWQSAKVE